MSTIVSLDLDDLACYHAIHGLEPPAPELAGVVLERWLPRFLDVFVELEIRATIFVIGRELQRDLAAGGAGAAVLERALAEGHELANHSHAHAYDLHTWSAPEIATDLAQGSTSRMIDEVRVRCGRRHRPRLLRRALAPDRGPAGGLSRAGLPP